MLFYSPEFVFAFLPIVVAGYYLLGRAHSRLSFVWLACASLFFYGYWDVRYVPLLLISVVCNYGVGFAIITVRSRGPERAAHGLCTAGVIGNIALLGYFKYLMFFAAQSNLALGSHFDIGKIVLPIGISFYTFTQVAFLVDAARGRVLERGFVSYLLFVTYFPHLLAGPILHHSEMMPQFALAANSRFQSRNFAMGVTLFAFGLCKKVVVADGVAPMARGIFDATPGGALAPADAWIGAVAYTLQIYFDFSGYSDMAVGLSLMFNIRLPINFFSPYRAKSMVEFWRRWHMTLSRFLREYVYIPLGGNRKGTTRRYLNVLVTMLLGGLWHGASVTFVIWGALHGAYLCVNLGWRAIAGRYFPESRIMERIVAIAAPALTFLAVVVAWVLFRAPSLDSAAWILSAMAGASADSPAARIELGQVAWLALLLLWAWLVPNANQVMGYAFGAEQFRGDVESARPHWRPTAGWAMACGAALFAVAVAAHTAGEKLAFLYFQF